MLLVCVDDVTILGGSIHGRIEKNEIGCVCGAYG